MLAGYVEKSGYEHVEWLDMHEVIFGSCLVFDICVYK
jgi:hypothetical protein